MMWNLHKFADGWGNGDFFEGKVWYSLVGILPKLDDPIKWDDCPWEFPLVDFPGQQPLRGCPMSQPGMLRVASNWGNPLASPKSSRILGLTLQYKSIHSAASYLDGLLWCSVVFPLQWCITIFMDIVWHKSPICIPYTCKSSANRWFIYGHGWLRECNWSKSCIQSRNVRTKLGNTYQT